VTPAERVVVTGGCGFLGEAVIRAFLSRNHQVLSFDKVDPEYRLDGVQYVKGDIRDESSVAAAVKGAGIVVHAVAAVPLAKSLTEFREVNVDGTAVAVRTSIAAGVRKFVYVSSSAVYGIPERNPVDEDDPRRPLESYGQAKSDAEDACRELSAGTDLQIDIIRPRTILGPGRLGIFGVLFDWISNGASVPVLGRGENVYQFVHVDDLAEVIAISAIDRSAHTLNIGGRDPETMRAALDGLCEHAATGARTFRIPKGMFSVAARASSALRLSPLAPYHWLLYGESLYFSGNRGASTLNWTPRYSSSEALIASYDSFLTEPAAAAGSDRSPHRSVPKQGMLGLLRGVSRVVFSGSPR
jgi:nucleoside-diphosphate-sugar epimerase